MTVEESVERSDLVSSLVQMPMPLDPLVTMEAFHQCQGIPLTTAEAALGVLVTTLVLKRESTLY